jgi:peptide/nickel transport system substrate-binding protein
MRKLMLIAALSVVAAACAAPTSQPTGVKTDDQPKSGGVLRDRINFDPFDYDTSIDGKSQPNPYFTGLAYDGLLRYKRDPGMGFTEIIPVPGIAEKWEVSPEGTVYTFHIRQGVKLAPSTSSGNEIKGLNGRDLTSADVKFMMEYYGRTGEFEKAVKDRKLPPGSFDYMLEGLQSVETPDKYTVVARFAQPFAPLLNYLGSEALPIVPREFYDKNGNLKDALVGTGPFQLDMEASQKGTRWVFKKNPTYWDTGRPYLDEVRHIVIAQDNTAVAAFQAKQIDHIYNIQPSDLANTIKSSVKDATVYEAAAPGSKGTYVTMNQKPFDDIRVRKALSMAIDREEFVRTFTAGKGEIAMAGVWPGYFSIEERRSILKYDPEGAKKLLAEAGYKDPVKFTELIRGPEEAAQNSKDAELLQAQLKKAGFDMSIEIDPDKASGSKRLHDGLFQLIGFITKPTYGDPDAYIYGAYHSKSNQNFEQVRDSKLDQLVEAQRRVQDPVQRRNSLREAARYLNESGLGIAIYHPINGEIWASNVQGVVPLAFGQHGAKLAQVWLTQ